MSISAGILPNIAANEINGDITYNQLAAITRALLQCTVADILAAPPTTYSNGYVCLISPTPTAAPFLNYPNNIAVYDNSQWYFLAPSKGWRVEVQASGASLKYDPALTPSWSTYSPNASSVTSVIPSGTGTPNTLAVFEDNSGRSIGSTTNIQVSGDTLFGFLRPIKYVALNSYKITQADCNSKIVFTSSTAVTVTLPQQSDSPIEVGFFCKVRQAGTGVVSFVVEGNDTIQSVYNAVSIGTRYGEAEVSLDNSTSGINIYGLSGSISDLGDYIELESDN